MKIKLKNFLESFKRTIHPMLVPLVVVKRFLRRNILTDKFVRYCENKVEYFEKYASIAHEKEVTLLFKKVDMRDIRGIVIYPYALSWEPIQRPQKILKAMGEQGYVCFFCDNSNSDTFTVKEKYKNVYSINKEEVLIEAFRESSVILYMSWPGQYPYSEFFPNSYIWYDLLDDVKTFSYAKCKSFIKKHVDLIYSVDLVTYSNDLYNPSMRENALLVTEDNILDVVNFINGSPKGWKTLANMNTSRVVSVFTNTFLDFLGEKYYAGGAERYLTDLHKIIKKLGFKMRIYQKAYFSWVRVYRGIEVCGISNDGDDIWNDSNFNRKFYSINNKRAALNIYSPFSLSLPFVASPAIGISHGIFWDDDRSNGEIDDELLSSAKVLNTFVSVDTNTCNWFQTRNMKIGHRMRYVPNYVDTDEFKPGCCDNDDGRIIILYPRRLYAPRGFDITLRVIDKVLANFPKAEFHFVGRGFEKDTDKLNKYIKKWGKRVKWYAEDPDNMYKVYQKATISLIPTLFSEGTSLSCLEAMASGNIVIASRVGGLSDLVINGLNGILIEPTKNSLEEALFSVLSDISSYENMRRMAIDVAKIFDKKSWNEKWYRILEKSLQATGLNEFSDSVVTNIHIKNGKTLEMYKKEISAALQKDHLVFVYCSEKLMNKNNSFGRLQYINDKKIEIK